MGPANELDVVAWQLLENVAENRCSAFHALWQLHDLLGGQRDLEADSRGQLPPIRDPPPECDGRVSPTSTVQLLAMWRSSVPWVVAVRLLLILAVEVVEVYGADFPSAIFAARVESVISLAACVAVFGLTQAKVPSLTLYLHGAMALRALGGSNRLRTEQGRQLLREFVRFHAKAKVLRSWVPPEQEVPSSRAAQWFTDELLAGQRVPKRHIAAACHGDVEAYLQRLREAMLQSSRLQQQQPGTAQVPGILHNMLSLGWLNDCLKERLMCVCLGEGNRQPVATHHQAIMSIIQSKAAGMLRSSLEGQEPQAQLQHLLQQVSASPECLMRHVQSQMSAGLRASLLPSSEAEVLLRALDQASAAHGPGLCPVLHAIFLGPTAVSPRAQDVAERLLQLALKAQASEMARIRQEDRTAGSLRLMLDMLTAAGVQDIQLLESIQDRRLLCSQPLPSLTELIDGLDQSPAELEGRMSMPGLQVATESLGLWLIETAARPLVDQRHAMMAATESHSSHSTCSSQAKLFLGNMLKGRAMLRLLPQLSQQEDRGLLSEALTHDVLKLQTFIQDVYDPGSWLEGMEDPHTAMDAQQAVSIAIHLFDLSNRAQADGVLHDQAREAASCFPPTLGHVIEVLATGSDSATSGQLGLEGAGVQCKVQMLQEIWEACHLLQARHCLTEQAMFTLSCFVRDVAGPEAGPRMDAEDHTGPFAWLRSLAATPLTVVCIVKAVMCWLVGSSFYDLAELSPQAEAAIQRSSTLLHVEGEGEGRTISIAEKGLEAVLHADHQGAGAGPRHVERGPHVWCPDCCADVPACGPEPSPACIVEGLLQAVEGMRPIEAATLSMSREQVTERQLDFSRTCARLLILDGMLTAAADLGNEKLNKLMRYSMALQRLLCPVIDGKHISVAEAVNLVGVSSKLTHIATGAVSICSVLGQLARQHDLHKVVPYQQYQAVLEMSGPGISEDQKAQARQALEGVKAYIESLSSCPLRVDLFADEAMGAVRKLAESALAAGEAILADRAREVPLQERMQLRQAAEAGVAALHRLCACLQLETDGLFGRADASYLRVLRDCSAWCAQECTVQVHRRLLDIMLRYVVPAEIASAAAAGAAPADEAGAPDEMQQECTVRVTPLNLPAPSKAKRKAKRRGTVGKPGSTASADDQAARAAAAGAAAAALLAEEEAEAKARQAAQRKAIKKAAKQERAKQAAAAASKAQQRMAASAAADEAEAAGGAAGEQEPQSPVAAGAAHATDGQGMMAAEVAEEEAGGAAHQDNSFNVFSLLPEEAEPGCADWVAVKTSSRRSAAGAPAASMPGAEDGPGPKQRAQRERQGMAAAQAAEAILTAALDGQKQAIAATQALAALASAEHQPAKRAWQKEPAAESSPASTPPTAAAAAAAAAAAECRELPTPKKGAEELLRQGKAAAALTAALAAALTAALAAAALTAAAAAAAAACQELPTPSQVAEELRWQGKAERSRPAGRPQRRPSAAAGKEVQAAEVESVSKPAAWRKPAAQAGSRWDDGFPASKAAKADELLLTAAQQDTGRAEKVPAGRNQWSHGSAPAHASAQSEVTASSHTEGLRAQIAAPADRQAQLASLLPGGAFSSSSSTAGVAAAAAVGASAPGWDSPHAEATPVHPAGVPAAAEDTADYGWGTPLAAVAAAAPAQPAAPPAAAEDAADELSGILAGLGLGVGGISSLSAASAWVMPLPAPLPSPPASTGPESTPASSSSSEAADEAGSKAAWDSAAEWSVPAAGSSDMGSAWAQQGPSLAQQLAAQHSLASCSSSSSVTWNLLAEPFFPPASPEPSPVAVPGLSNATGEYNCFLNVIIQCLWHCRDFRAAVLAWQPAFYQADPVVAALHALLQEVQAAEQAGGSAAGARRGVVDPGRLREALSALPGQEFKVGEMSDAGEVLLTLYERIGEVSDAAGLPSQPDAIFGLPVTEAVHCPSCGVISHQTCYTQYFFNVAATALRQHAAQAAELRRRGRMVPRTLGGSLRAIEDSTPKSCDTDVGGCGRAGIPVTHTLERAPAVFSLQLTWESHQEQAQDIRATLQQVQMEIELREVYAGSAAREAPRYRLRSMACYYGSHYLALVLVALPGGAQWALLDDASVSVVGCWQDVVAKCEGGRIQPSVLFFERQASGNTR